MHYTFLFLYNLMYRENEYIPIYRHYYSYVQERLAGIWMYIDICFKWLLAFFLTVIDGGEK